MIIWLNGAFGAGKSATARKLNKLLKGSFIYDPEQIGYFIRKNAPKQFSHGDFQDIPLWREFNYKMLKMLAQKHDGPVIVPMTLVNRDYYDEIIGALTAGGLDVRHFILYLDKPALIKRLRKRAFGLLAVEKFAVNSIDRCIHSFDNIITETKIMVGSKSVGQVAAMIMQSLPEEHE